MALSIAHIWRIAATYLAAGAFHIGGLLVTLPLIALCWLVPGTRSAKELRSQRVIQRSFRCFAAALVALGLMTCSRRGVERLRAARGCLVIANHPSLLDVVLLIGSMPRVDCVVKLAVWNNYFMRATVCGAGYIANHDGPRVVQECVERLARGRSILLFPEGTRSPAGGLRPFQRATARIALRSGCPILPVRITCDPPTLLKGQRWYQVPARRPHFTLEVLDPIPSEPSAVAGQESPREVRDLVAYLEDFYARQLGLRPPARAF